MNVFRLLSASIACVVAVHGAWGQSLTNGTPPTMVLLSTKVASSSASLDFTGLDATFQTYSLRCHAIVPGNDGANVNLQFGTGGTPTYQTANYQYSYITNTAFAATPTGISSINDTGINLGGAGLYNSTGQLARYEANVSDLASTGYKMIDFKEAGFTNGGGTFRFITGSGTWTGATTAITALRFKMGAGNITSGTCSLYGIN